ncbi:UNVERIFIED_CONTAM: hypothetical protein Sradi_3665700 [Sesamum radiatum]|uniref:Endonuclease/exonuclease/phosphatase domain-containing protein n=1 Tax=Sesamum radiatum TaxID=300843 RepID=A0AAW2QJ79_SESRA
MHQPDQSWERLTKLADQTDMPWICLGDFDEILSQDEKTGARRPLSPIQVIRNPLQMCDLYDLGYTGEKFTWWNRREHPHTVRERLDRACANSAWKSKFPIACVTHLPLIYSDHCPMLLETEQGGLSNPQKETAAVSI